MKFSIKAVATEILGSAILLSCVNSPSLIFSGSPLTNVARRMVSIDQVASDGLMI